MSQVESVSVALSLVLGLGVALLLTSAVAAFRARRDVDLDFVPVAWAAYVFVSQLQYWWGPVFLLNTFERVSGVAFVILTFLAVLLFLAGALVLHPEVDRDAGAHTGHFDSDGRWGVLAYGLFWFLAVPLVNLWLYRVPITHPANLTGELMAGLAAITFWTPRLRRVATIAAGVVLLLNTLTASAEVLRLLGIEP